MSVEIPKWLAEMIEYSKEQTSDNYDAMKELLTNCIIHVPIDKVREVGLVTMAKAIVEGYFIEDKTKKYETVGEFLDRTNKNTKKKEAKPELTEKVIELLMDNSIFEKYAKKQPGKREREGNE